MFGAIVFYGIGSPYAADLEEVSRRAGLQLVAGVANVAGETFLSGGVTVIAPGSVLPRYAGSAFVAPMIGPAFRKTAADEARGLGLQPLPALIDPSAVVASSAVLGPGVTINAGVVIAAAARLGEQVLINRSASVGHHCELDDYVTIGPGAVLAGQVHVGRGAFVGAGAVLLPQTQIGANAIIGAGAVVTREVPANSVAVGNPARVVKSGIAGYRDQGVP